MPKRSPPKTKRAFLLFITLAGIGFGQEDALAIVKRSLAADNRNDTLLRNYTYKTLHEIHVFGGAGDVKFSGSTLEDTLYIGGKAFSRVIAKDGKPLPEPAARKEQAKLDKAFAAAAHQTPSQRTAIERQETRQRERDRERLQYVPRAFRFRLLGEEPVNGRDAWKIEAIPTGTYRGPHESSLRNLQGTLWIDKRDYEWVKVEAESLDTIAFGVLFARVAKGARLTFENSKVNDEIWARKRISMKTAMRVGLLIKLRTEIDETYSDYRKFQTDSRMISSEEPGK